MHFMRAHIRAHAQRCGARQLGSPIINHVLQLHAVVGWLVMSGCSKELLRTSCLRAGVRYCAGSSKLLLSMT